MDNENKTGIREIIQVTRNRFLNYFHLKACSRAGKEFDYYMASRSEDVSKLLMNNPQKGPDGVAIFGVYGEKHDRVVLIRQFRYPLGGYVYEFPAGLVEQGENFHDTAVREVREETGLILHPLDVDSMYERSYFTTVGMTDENCAMVFGYCEGEAGLSGLEDTEDLQVILADRAEASRILHEERVAMNCAYMLMRFVEQDKDPFAFLEKCGS